MAQFGMVLIAQVRARCLKWFGDAEGKKVSDKVRELWRALHSSKQNELQSRLKSTFVKSVEKNEHFRTVVNAYAA